MQNFTELFDSPPFPTLFQDLLQSPARSRTWGTKTLPEVDIEEREHAYVISANVPGVTSEQIELTVDKNVITLLVKNVGEESKDGQRSYLHRERLRGSVRRTIQLPEAVLAEVGATLKDGVLTVTAEKDRASRTRKVNIVSA